MSTEAHQGAPRSEKRKATTDVTELAPGVLRSELPINLPGLGHVNCYMLQDGDGVALVDPGLPGEDSWNALVDRLKRAHYRVSDVHTVIVTHSHFDHYGGAERLREEAGARIVGHSSLAHWRSKPELHDVSEFMAPDDIEQRIPPNDGPLGHWTPWGTWSQPPAEIIEHWQKLGVEDFETPAIDHALDDGNTITLARREWVTVHTPGHTADHVCLYDADAGLMITGDHVLPTITPHISGFAAPNGPLGHFFDSLQRMHEFTDVTLALPAHGDPFDDLYGRADSICAHHDGRLDEIRSLNNNGEPASVEDYMKHLFRERSWGDMAASETYAHLVHLRDAGELTTTWSDGLMHFH